MKRLVMLMVIVGMLLPGHPAAAAPTVTVSPSPVQPGETFTVRVDGCEIPEVVTFEFNGETKTAVCQPLPGDVTVPDVVGDDIGSATATLQAEGLTVSVVRTETDGAP